MIIAIIYIVLSYMILDQQLKITSRKSSGPPPEKIHSPLFTSWKFPMHHVNTTFDFLGNSPIQKKESILLLNKSSKTRNHLEPEHLETLFLLSALKVPIKSVSNYQAEIKYLEDA